MNDTVNKFRTLLESRNVLVSDGAMGTNLQTLGLPPGRPGEDWLSENPDAIRGLHQRFVEAGSDIILTCSFGGNGLTNAAHSDREVLRINTLAATLARSVADEADREVLVGGSMGPTGKLMEPFGPLTEEAVSAAYERQAAALQDGGVDLLVLETFYDLGEAVAAVKGVRRASSLPLVCSFSYDSGLRTMMGVAPEKMADAIVPLGVDAIGANCGTTVANMAQIVMALVGLNTGVPIWAKPNAGVPSGSPPVYDTTPEQMGDTARRLVEIGAQIVGGCCGNSPEHVRAIARAATSAEKLEDA